MAIPYQLTIIKGGIDRLRPKGAAQQDVMYDLLNGQVSEKKTVRVRPGTIRDTLLPEGTKGLCAFRGNLVVFAAETISVPAGYELRVITHPSSGADVVDINKVYFATPFMGFLYVVADFVGFEGDYYHFWLQTGSTWQASHVYKFGEIVLPSTPNGFSYQASRLGAPSLMWAPGVKRALADIIEPTVYNDYKYTVVDVLGSNPRSGSVEPEWPVESGARVSEDADGVGDTAAGETTATPDNTDTPNPDTADRYEGGV